MRFSLGWLIASQKCELKLEVMLSKIEKMNKELNALNNDTIIIYAVCPNDLTVGKL